MTPLVVIGDVEVKLQRLQWRPGQSCCRPFRFCAPTFFQHDHNSHFMEGHWRQHNSDSELSWRRHEMESFSALLVPCAGYSPVTGKGQWNGCFLWSAPEQTVESRRRWFETPSRSLWCHCNYAALHAALCAILPYIGSCYLGAPLYWSFCRWQMDISANKMVNHSVAIQPHCIY